MSDITRRQMTDAMDVHCNKELNWGMYAKMLNTFVWPLILRQIPNIPSHIALGKNKTAKVQYLYALCTKYATKADYKNTKQTFEFDAKNFKW